jgi:hypothetical protein
MTRVKKTVEPKELTTGTKKDLSRDVKDTFKL